MKAPTTALSATLSQDLASQSGPDSAGCVCRPEGVRATFDECACDWGKLVRQMLYLGYGASALEASQELADLGGRINILACRRRREILQTILDVWEGTTTDFCDLVRITRSKLADLGLRRPK